MRISVLICGLFFTSAAMAWDGYDWDSGSYVGLNLET